MKVLLTWSLRCPVSQVGKRSNQLDHRWAHSLLTWTSLLATIAIAKTLIWKLAERKFCKSSRFQLAWPLWHIKSYNMIRIVGLRMFLWRIAWRDSPRRRYLVSSITNRWTPSFKTSVAMRGISRSKEQMSSTSCARNLSMNLNMFLRQMHPKFKISGTPKK